MILPIQRVPSARIAGVVSCVPSQVVDNVSLGEAIGLPSVQRLVAAIGVRQRRVAPAHMRLSQLVLQAAEHLLEQLAWARDSVGGVLLITQTPDRRIPATACHLHRALGLGGDCFAFDVNLGCSAYPYGLWMAQKLMAPGAARRVLLVVGDLASRHNNASDSGNAFLFGDAATVTALECRDDGREDLVILGTDGTGEEAILLDNCNPPCLQMNGREVASFAIDVVPRIIASLNAAVAGDPRAISSHDHYLLHQANEQLLTHIAQKLSIPAAAMPIHLANYGNTASASIPLLITTDLGAVLTQRQARVAMVGFGTGLSWAAISRIVDPLDVVACIDFEDGD